MLQCGGQHGASTHQLSHWRGWNKSSASLFILRDAGSCQWVWKVRDRFKTFLHTLTSQRDIPAAGMWEIGVCETEHTSSFCKYCMCLNFLKHFMCLDYWLWTHCNIWFITVTSLFMAQTDIYFIDRLYWAFHCSSLFIFFLISGPLRIWLGKIRKLQRLLYSSATNWLLNSFVATPSDVT